MAKGKRGKTIDESKLVKFNAWMAEVKDRELVRGELAKKAKEVGISLPAALARAEEAGLKLPANKKKGAAGKTAKTASKKASKGKPGRPVKAAVSKKSLGDDAMDILMEKIRAKKAELRELLAEFDLETRRL